MNKIRFVIICLFLNLIISIHSNAQCGCTFSIGPGTGNITFDGIQQGAKGGDVICLLPGLRAKISFQNLIGSPTNYITIKNCGGKAEYGGAASSNALAFYGSRYFRLTGTGDPGLEYGIKIIESKPGSQGIVCGGLSSDFEIDHIEIQKAGFAGIMAKTDPNCDNTSVRPNFTMYNVSLHDNYFHEITGEGIYLGNSFYKGTEQYCGYTQYAHEIRGVRIYNNIVDGAGWEAIQVGSAVYDVEVYNNRIYNYGAQNKAGQNGGIQLGSGATGRVYNNFIKNGTGPGFWIQGIGELYFYNNIVINPGFEAFNVNVRPTPLATDIVPTGWLGGVYIINNTVVSAAYAAIRENINEAPGNIFKNNLIVNSTTNWNQLKSTTDWEQSNNVFIPNMNDAKFVDPANDDYRLQSSSPAINAGINLTSLGINIDHIFSPRPSGTNFDVGAFEFQSGGPQSNAGPDKSITLPTNSIILNGSGTSATGITGYLWTKKSGGVATLTNATTANLSVAGMVAGTYVFEFRVIDASGFAFDEVTVNVLPLAANQNPVANAGGNKTITLPTNSIILSGIGTDADGSITSYIWTKVSGPAAALTNANTPNLGLTALVQGVYVFQLTVTDNNSATASSQATVTVNAAAANQVPIVNAGTAKTIFLPTNQVIITATASDPDGSISTIIWEKKSGGVATLTNANTLTVTASGLAAGTYTYRITVTDNNSATAFSEVIVNVIAGNQSPTANAGADQTITLPTNNIVLAGSGNDPDGSVVGYAWVKISGPTASLTNTNTATLTITNMLQGVYVFNLTVTDNNGATGSDLVTVTVNASVPVPSANEIPLAIAGGNVSFSLPTNSINLYGSGFDPDGTIVAYNWVKASGGSATLTNTDKPTLTASNLQAGQYTFRLTVTDDDGATDDDIAVVTISALGTNIFPVASAGADQIIKLPINSLLLIGTGTDEDGQIVSYAWTQTKGGPANISTQTTSSTMISGLSEGEYTFRLTVTDNLGATDLNEVNVRVVTNTGNLPPIVDAGPDIKIFLPQSTLSINASAIDEGSITAFQWAKLIGPSVTLVNPSEQNLSLTNLIQGEYTFQLTVTDNNSASAFDLVKVSVLPQTFIPPSVNAGIDQEITLPINQISLTGTASSTTGSIVSTIWEKTLGPSVTLSGANTLNLQCTGMQAGTYIFTLTATDNAGKVASDNVQVVVHPIPPNQPPLVDAGPNQSVILPASIVFNGNALDTDGTVTSLSWSQVLGSPVSLSGISTSTLTASNITELGFYTFRLTAKDDSGNENFDDVVLYTQDPSQTGSYKANFLSFTLPTQIGSSVIDTITNTINLTVGLPEGELTLSPTFEISTGAIAYSNGQPQASGLNEQDFSSPIKYSILAADSITEKIWTVTVLNQGLQALKAPLYFSPNNDGQNDQWIIENLYPLNSCSVEIFSRAGQVVYKADTYLNNWDGTVNGRPVAEGDYYYVFTCEGSKIATGSLRVIR